MPRNGSSKRKSPGGVASRQGKKGSPALDNTEVEAAQRFLQLLDPAATEFEFRTFDDNKSRKDKNLTRTFYGTLAAHAAKLQRLNQNGAGVYVVINETDGRGRKAENVIRVRAVFADLDGVPLEPAMQPTPHMVVNSSPNRFHVYWRITGLALEDFVPTQKAISARCNSDPGVSDLPRVMRLPGFFHCKGKRFLVQLQHTYSGAAYTATNFGKTKATLLAEYAAQLLPSAPVDVEARLAAMTYQGEGDSGIHSTNLSVSAALLTRKFKANGVITDDDITEVVERLLHRQREVAPADERWNWDKEERDLRRMCTDWVKKIDSPPDDQKLPPPRSPIYTFPAVADIPPWDFLYGTDLLRKTVSGTAAQGATGKTTLSLGEAMAIATGKPLLGVSVPRPMRVLVICLEDNRNAVDKRIAAAMAHHNLNPSDFGNHRLHVLTKGEINMRLVGLRHGQSKINEPVLNAFRALLAEGQYDVVSIDPFIRCHSVPENDNTPVAFVVELFDSIAEEFDCAISLWHHTRKGGGLATTVESARGGFAFVDACRSVRILETMTKEEAGNHKDLLTSYKGYFRSYSGKLNFAPPVDVSTWYRLESVLLNNGPHGAPGDNVGVVTPWQHPGTVATDLDEVGIAAIRAEVGTEIKWRDSIQAAMWVGKAVASVLGLDPDDDKLLLKKILKKLLHDKVLKTVSGATTDRHPALFVVCA